MHDEASLRISALSLQLGLLPLRDTADVAGLEARIDVLQDELHAVLQELRDVAGQIYPPLLDQAGLGPALRELVDRLGAEVAISAPAVRFGPAAEAAAYFAIAECLACPDAGSPVTLAISRELDELVLSFAGGSARCAEVIGDLAGPLGGTVEPIVGCGPNDTTITVRIPCE